MVIEIQGREARDSSLRAEPLTRCRAEPASSLQRFSLVSFLLRRTEGVMTHISGPLLFRSGSVELLVH